MSSDRSTIDPAPARGTAPAAGLPPPVDVGQTQPLQNDFQAPVTAENNYDDGALHPNQVTALQQHLSTLRRENEEYLAQHGELRTLVSSFIAGVVDQQPEDVRDFAAEFFTEANRQKRAREAGSQRTGGRGERPPNQ